MAEKIDDGAMTFVQWLAEEMVETNDDMIEIGFGEESSMEDIYIN